MAVLKTWGKRCNRLIFVTSKHDDQLGDTFVPRIKESYLWLWAKEQVALEHLYANYKNETDWFLKADDDTYVFVENLRYFLYAYSPQMPIYFGHNLKQLKNSSLSYMSGGAGYVFSHEALRRFIEVPPPAKYRCKKGNPFGAEDSELGYCLHALGVIAGDARDASYKIRFLPFPVSNGLSATYFRQDFWWFWLSYYDVQLCNDCLSEYLITAHYITPHLMYLYEFFNYEFEVPGDLDDSNEPLPRKVSFDELLVPASDNSREIPPDILKKA